MGIYEDLHNDVIYKNKNFIYDYKTSGNNFWHVIDHIITIISLFENVVDNLVSNHLKIKKRWVGPILLRVPDFNKIFEIVFL